MMALRDAEKEALEWAQLVPDAIRVLGDLSDSDDVRSAADALEVLPVGVLARELAKLRNDRADIMSGQGEIKPGIKVVIGGKKAEK